MNRHSQILRPGAAVALLCPESGFRYELTLTGTLCCLDLDEKVPLPAELAVGKKVYDEFKAR